MTFDTVKFEQILRAAAKALDEAVDILDAADQADIAPPGKWYLMARLHIAQEIVELELPEFQRAAAATVADMLTEVE